MTRPAFFAAGLCTAALAAGAGCGSSTSRTTTQTGGRSGPAVVVDGVAARSVERALGHVSPPAPTDVACRATSPSERATAPFGPTSLPLFTCELTLGGERATYVVQVLRNGCFVAERRRPGRAVYGCGVVRS